MKVCTKGTVMSGYLKRILVVEDEDAARDILCALLVQARYAVFAARNGQEAFAEVQREHFDVVVIDCDRPHLDGRGLLSLNRVASPPTPVIILSGGPAESSEVVTQLGAYAWVEKPYDTYVLLEIIGNAAQAAAQTT